MPAAPELLRFETIPRVDLLSAIDSEQQQRRIAGTLHELGLRAGDRVALITSSSTSYVSAVLAMLRSGIVAVPLDPSLTSSEREPLLRDIAPSCIIDDDSALRRLAQGPQRNLDPFPRSRPMHFTSGTTGRSKGVWSGFLTPDHAKAAALEERSLWDFNETDVHLVVSPTYHSAPLRFAMGTLLAGGSIAVLPHFDPADFAAHVSALRPTTVFCVPAHLQRLFGWIDAGGTMDAASFRLIAHAGAPCPEPTRIRAHDFFGPDVVWEFYGSTEGQFTSCPAPLWRDFRGTVGRPRAGRTLTTDSDGQLWCTVPPWGAFEYWHDPEKTAAAWKQTNAGPAFTVGDLGRIIDGLVYLDSRRTDLIITGGVNVYPAEIEAALEGTPDLLDVAIYGVPDDHWGQRVCAAYVGTVTEERLREIATSRLAPAKRPKTYRKLSSLPRTHTGKIRRTELAATETN